MENKTEYDFNIKHQLNYHVIPFAYSLKYKQANICYKEKCEGKLWRLCDIGDENLLKHINNLINVKNDESGIARRYILDQKGRSKIGIPTNTQYKFTLTTGKGDKYKLIIESIELILFETNIGFVIIKLKYPDQFNGQAIDIDTLININYNVKHLNISKTKLEYTIKKSKDEKEDKSLCFNDIIDAVTKDLHVTTYFENNDKIKAHSTLLYNALVLDKAPSIDDFENNKELIRTFLFRMRRVFKESYKASENELFMGDDFETLQLFENIYWGASLEGIACLCYEVEDEVTNKFIDSNYIHKLENSYFLLYILILHIRYSLMNFSIRSAFLPKTIEECVKLEKDKCSVTISKLEEEISFFKLRCTFKDVSNVTHQKKLYGLMWKIHNINELLDELDSQIKTLSVMSNLRERQVEKEEKAKREIEKNNQEKKENRFKDTLVGITTTFTILSAIANIGKIAESFEKIYFRTQTWIELTVTVIIFVCAVVFLTWYPVYIIRKRSKKIE